MRFIVLAEQGFYMLGRTLLLLGRIYNRNLPSRPLTTGRERRELWEHQCYQCVRPRTIIHCLIGDQYAVVLAASFAPLHCSWDIKPGCWNDRFETLLPFLDLFAFIMFELFPNGFNSSIIKIDLKFTEGQHWDPPGGF